MSLAVIGIDPGNEGALAFLEYPDSVVLEPMPQDDKGNPDIRELARLLSHYAPQAARVYLELPGLRPGESPWSTSVAWRNFGRIEGLLLMLGARIHVVRSNKWSEAYDHGVTERDPVRRKRAIKVARREIVGRLYPGLDLRKNDRCSVPHEGIVDALLLADFGRQQLKEGITA